MENLDPNCNGTRIRADNQQENYEKMKTIIIKGRRVKKRVKILHFDDSDDSQSDDDYKLNRRKANKQDGRADDANIFNLKDVFSNKLLSGKILSHWTDKCISANNLNLMETTNTLINKIANSGYETIFASIDKFEPIDGWNCDLELEQKSTTENINEFNTLDKMIINDDIIDSNILLAEPEIEPVVKTKKEFIPENIQQENFNEVDVGSKHSLSTINPVLETLSAKQIVDKSFGQAPAIVSSLNSWFSDIRSATKLAASSTVSHAVKKLTTNAQNILTSEQSDLWVPSSVDASLKLNSFNKTEQEVPLENVDSIDHLKTGDDWEEEWDEEPIKLTSIIKTESIDLVSSNFEELKTCDEIHKESIETSNVITNTILSVLEEQNLSEIQNDSPKKIEQSENFTIKMFMPFDEEKQETFNIQSDSLPASLADPDDKIRLNDSNGDNLENEPEIDLKILDELPKEPQPIDEFSENTENFALILKDSSSEIVAPNFVTNEATTSSRTANEELETATITETWDSEWGDDTFSKQIESDKTTLPNLLEETVPESNSDTSFIGDRALEQTSDVIFEHEHSIDGPVLECLSWEADWNNEDTLNLTSKPIHSDNTRDDINANAENATVEEHIQSANNATSTETFTGFITGNFTSESFSSVEKITNNPQSETTDFICADPLTTNILNTKCIDNSMAKYTYQQIDTSNSINVPLKTDESDHEENEERQSIEPNFVQSKSEMKISDDYYSIEGNDDEYNANKCNEDPWSDEATSIGVLEKRSDDRDTSTEALKKSAPTEPKDDMKEMDKNQSLLRTVRTATISSSSQAKIESNLEKIELHNENEFLGWDNFSKLNTFSIKNETRKALTKKTVPQASSTVSLPKSIPKDQDITRPAKKRQHAIFSLDQKNKVIDGLFTSSTSTKASSSAQKLDDVSKKITAKKVENNTNVDWSNDWNSEWDDDLEPITLPSHERRNSNLTNISIDSDWSADWKCKPKAKPLPAPSRKSSTSSNSSSVSKTVPEQHRQPHYYHRESQPTPPPKLDATFRGLDNESMSRRDYASRPTGSSSSWFSDLRSATRNAASTTMSHAVNRWSFNPTNILDAVVDNISNAVGIPSAEEMASVMSQQKKAIKNEK